MSHVVFFVGNFFSGSQGHVDTQNWVTYVTQKPIVHRDTGSRWSRRSRGVFFEKFCFWVTGSRGSRCGLLVNFVSGTHGHAGHVGHNVFLRLFFWVTGSRWSHCVILRKKFLGHRVTWVT